MCLEEYVLGVYGGVARAKRQDGILRVATHLNCSDDVVLSPRRFQTGSMRQILPHEVLLLLHGCVDIRPGRHWRLRAQGGSSQRRG